MWQLILGIKHEAMTGRCSAFERLMLLLRLQSKSKQLHHPHRTKGDGPTADDRLLKAQSGARTVLVRVDKIELRKSGHS
uniref:Uncharacterized protein n=1 Tax=Globodera rostochiensis TaxID=31243 RepID=A0A914HMQ0_GLORO